eukprot:TRINITY_DN1681_c1_g1_i1.p1 TRINITY_DN1681_c1_g1~~TRINITY_DN1681_c1_g1_i1.p1  ORF type:complete len:322 (+),score=18.26 TRINITY_DN1681_c1_g1_i1:132-1097(+)
MNTVPRLYRWQRAANFFKSKNLEVKGYLAKLEGYLYESNALLDLERLAPTGGTYKTEFLEAQCEYFEQQCLRRMYYELAAKQLYIAMAEREGIRVKYWEVWELAFKNLEPVHSSAIRSISERYRVEFLKVTLSSDRSKRLLTRHLNWKAETLSEYISSFNIKPKMIHVIELLKHTPDEVYDDPKKFLAYYLKASRRRLIIDCLEEVVIPEPCEEAKQIFRVEKARSRSRSSVVPRGRENSWVRVVRTFATAGMLRRYSFSVIAKVYRAFPKKLRKDPLLFLKFFIQIGGRDAQEIFDQGKKRHNLVLPSDDVPARILRLGM